MVETKDSAALFLPSTEVLSHGRSARRIGRVRSHKRSLRNQFRLFVNTRDDFHSPGGIPPQDHVVVCSPSVHFITSRRELGIAIVARQKVPRRPESPIRSVLLFISLFFFFLSVSSRFSAFLLKNNRRVAELARAKRTETSERRRLSEASKTSSCKLTRNAYRKSAGLFSHRARLRRSEHVVVPPVVRKDIISFSAL